MTNELHLTVTPAEFDLLRFVLGVVVTEDFESEADRVAYLSLCDKVGAY